jgi:hypothetical protein
MMRKTTNFYQFLKFKIMPIQDGHNPLIGTVDNLTYYKTRDGYKVRKKGGPAPGAILKDLKFARTRETMSEFSEAASKSKLMRESLRSLLQNIADQRMANRLQSVLFRVTRTDTTHPRGLRKVANGNFQLLRDFDFNANAALKQTFGPLFSTSYDRVSGDSALTVPAFSPDQNMYAPFEATHYRVVFALAEIDFANGTANLATTMSDALSVKVAEQPQQLLERTLQPNGANPVFMLVGINFYQLDNGDYHMLKNGAFNALRVMEVSTP